ncbi:MAG: sulfurtransferase complex subunit TusB [Ketobacteraceae bacterium]|nr:sulfurtransferase complex subunit TusB [Ketobacteraceae bacterium]
MEKLNTLHIVAGSPFQNGALDRCLKAARENDGILLIEDGVYSWQLLQSFMTERTLSGYVLEPDIIARNLEPTPLNRVSYDDFVELCTRYSKTVSWF